MRQKSVNKSDEAKRGIARTRWDIEKEVLELLADKYQPTEIKNRCPVGVRTVHRIRVKAIADFPAIKRKLSLKVQEYLRSWAKEHSKELIEEGPHKTQKERLRRHEEDLCKVARKVYAELCECCAWPADMTIEEINVERNDPKLVGLFLEKPVIGLLAHLQTDIEDLKPFARWEDLTPDDITKDLLDSISMKAAKREFNGKCDICGDY